MGSDVRSHSNHASRSGEAAPENKSRPNLIAVFDWLWRNGVREIVRIVVNDRDPPHTDSAIVDALYGFKVQRWDWKKIDLCSEVICDSSNCVEEVSLYSSGNNAVLMGWSSADGFASRDKFPKVGYFACRCLGISQPQPPKQCLFIFVRFASD